MVANVSLFLPLSSSIHRVGCVGCQYSILTLGGWRCHSVVGVLIAQALLEVFALLILLEVPVSEGLQQPLQNSSSTAQDAWKIHQIRHSADGSGCGSLCARPTGDARALRYARAGPLSFGASLAV